MAIWRDGTSATREAWQVEAACANITHAAQHAAGGTDDLFVNGGWDDSGGAYSIIPKIACTGAAVFTTQLEQWTLFRARRDMTFTKIRTFCRGTAGVGGSLARMGLFTQDGSGNLTMVARTASDATLWSISFTTYERALDTTGGFPASYAITRGNLYALGAIWVGSGTAPTPGGCQGSNAIAGTFGFTWNRSRTAQADLGDATNAQASGAPGNAVFGELAP